MFRVDPKFKKLNSFGQLIAPETEEYDIIQLSQNLPVWLLLISTIDADSAGVVRSRYGFGNLLEALQIAVEERWHTSDLYEIFPSGFTKDGEPCLAKVTGVWEAAPSEVFRPGYEVKTKYGIQMLSEDGRAMEKSIRRDQLWPIKHPQA